ncbi:potassium channel subfamily K member 2 isoform X1 [Procambarus clarkii]|uniref:potassium channel subfamily K member 2 isoform X1 n=2 Tax=Procambarus clarkii TaxID=6728 RepID=UPI0037430B8E
MMSYKQWLVLLGMYVAFMLMGAVGFLYLEEGKELEEMKNLLDLKQKVIRVVSELANGSRGPVEDMMKAVSEKCDHDFLQEIQDRPLTWSLWNSFFFTFTVITTIGYGHMYPATSGGRIFCIVYAFVGVPFNGILVASLADLFSSKVVNLQVRKYAKRYQSWVKVAADTLLYMVPGMVVFLIVPAAVLTQVEEDWSYLDAFYFAFITLTTIGFGDHVAGMQEKAQVWLWLYKIVMVVWIFFGLGYIIMIITFIQKALQSKQVHNVERKLASALKRRTNRLNANVHRDLKRLRMAVIALGVTRVQPLYIDGDVEEEGQTVMVREIKRRASSKQSFRTSISGSPPSTPISRSHSMSHTHTLTRSISESQLNDVCKARVEELESLSNINMLLDMVETMVQERNAMAAEDMQHEFRQIVEAEDVPPVDDDSFGESDETYAVHELPLALETGFLNQAFIDDEGRVVDKRRSLEDTRRDANTSLHGRLQKKLQLLLHGRYPRKTSLPECAQSSVSYKSPWRIRPEGDCEAWGLDTPHNTTNTNCMEIMRPLSHSVPGRIKTHAEEARPHLSSVFTHREAGQNGTCKSQEHTLTNGVQNLNKVLSSQSMSEGFSEPQPTPPGEYQSPMNIFTQWMLQSEGRRDPGQARHHHHNNTNHHKEKDETVKNEHTRL